PGSPCRGPGTSPSPAGLCPWSTRAPRPRIRCRTRSSASLPRPPSPRPRNPSRPLRPRERREHAMNNQPTALARISEAGVSVWQDDLSRTGLNSGDLAQVIAERHVVGVTTNPTIFAKAVSEGTAYDDQLEKLAASGADVDAAVLELTTDDVRTACDVFRDTFEATDGKDGRVSIEVDPRLAHDTEATIAEARKLWNTVNRPNLFGKIPATKEGLPAIAAATAAGISVNVTLIFSLDRYRAVTQA